MPITLIPAAERDIPVLWQMQAEAFAGLLKKYRDFDTNPGAESLERVTEKFRQPWTAYFFIEADGEKVGGIRVADKKDGSPRKIGPIWIMPEFRNRGYAQEAILAAERLYGPDRWRIDTILQEPGNLYLYEKLGYRRTGRTEKINERMDIVILEKN